MSTTAQSLAPGSRVAIRNYASRNRWLPVEDLEQEAALAALEAGRVWKPDGGTSRELWEAWIVAQALSRLVAETRVPVSLPKHKGESWKEAAACRRAEVEARPYYLEGTSEYATGEPTGEDPKTLARLAFLAWIPMEDRLDAERSAAELRRLMAGEPEVARAVLLGEEKPAVVAERTGTPVARVYAQTLLAMRHLKVALCPREVEA